MTETDAIKLFKCLADKSRMQILKSLIIEDMYVERLAERLGLTPATISFHLKKLEDAGAVKSYKDQYYTCLLYTSCMAGSFIFGLQGGYRGLELAGFMGIMFCGILTSTVIGGVIGIGSRNQMAATSVTVPVMMIFSFLPFICCV